MTRYPDRRPLRDRPPHWPTTIMLTVYLLAYAVGAYFLWRFIHGISDAVGSILK